MKISVVAFEAKSGKNLIDQTNNCLDQLNKFLSQSSLKTRNLISINFFIATRNNGDYRHQVEELNNHLPQNLIANVPVAFLAQAPANGKLVSAEIYYLLKPGNATFTPKTEGGHPYLVIQKNDAKLVIANGIGVQKEDTSITGKSEEVFSIMERILATEGLDFSDIFRQWNYIQDITGMDQENGFINQHYQQFNNVRTKYYAKSQFRSGYPAATGIGIDAGGVVVSFYAARGKRFTTVSFENSLQKAAFKYTAEVLAGNSEYPGFSNCTPKFARARLIANSESEQVFISGTASIRDQVTVGENNVIRQTEITLDNIQNLLSKNTLTSIKGATENLPEIKFIRVYIKHPEDYLPVKDICEKRLPGVPAIYVVSDVCRDSLLVEIEALAES